jgi:hypothetical protein
VARSDVTNLEVYQLAERLADTVWSVVVGWPHLPQRTLGEQLVRAADSVADDKRFVRIARGSLNEVQYWLRRAYCRKLLTPEQVRSLRPMIDELLPRLNAYLRSIGTTKGPASDATDNGPLTTDT